MPQLDTLRFFAVLGVLITHNWGDQNLPWIFGALSPGTLGVHLFFVLSGFLITGILLDCRSIADATSQNPLFFIRQFYLRRFLRIFPIYYLMIATAVAVNLPPARDIWIWLVTYTSNIYISLHRHWIGHVGHFWTLAVEEQFYIVWPWLMLCVPRKWLVPMASLTIVLAPLYRVFAITNFPNDIASGLFTTFTFTFARLDSLGSGAILALVARSGFKREIIQKYLNRFILPIGAISFAALFSLHYYDISSAPVFICGDILLAMMLCWLVNSASQGFKGILGNLLEFKPFVYLGKISYGIYVYHSFVPLLLVLIFEQCGIDYHKTGLLNFVLLSLVTFGIASLSWHLFELPINDLKRYFEYSPRPTVELEVSRINP
jgi:peptidoglycan/LPS O-acetylase OafA/YrhL